MVSLGSLPAALLTIFFIALTSAPSSSCTLTLIFVFILQEIHTDCRSQGTAVFDAVILAQQQNLNEPELLFNDAGKSLVEIMFSTFTSFLPSALQSHHSHENNMISPSKSTSDHETGAEYKLEQPVEDDTGAKKGATSTRTRNVNEVCFITQLYLPVFIIFQTFIVVRPPPAKSNHPLNLQVQLVPPTLRNPRQSLDEPDSASTTTSLTRTFSTRSDTSSYGSTASFSSTGSASSVSGRRAIIPLYNLHAHNVMTNTIVDAGTDAKIARFQKRGIELIDLAVLEPVEVWGETGRGKASRPSSPDFFQNAYSSATSLQPNSPYQSPSQLPSALPAVPPAKRNNIFGKLFKKSGKDATPPSPLGFAFPASPTSTQSALDPGGASSMTPTQARSRGHARNLSATLSPSTITDKLKNRSPSPNPAAGGLGVPVVDDNASTHSSSNADHTTSDDKDKVLRPPVLGIQPTLSFCSTSSTGATSGFVQQSTLSKTARALMYVWFVRKWLKRKDRNSFMGNITDEEATNGIFGKMRGSTKQASLLASGGVSEGVEVRFEWRRLGGKSKARRGRLGRRRSRVSLPGVDGDEDENTERERTRERDNKQSHRLSVISQQSVSTNMSVSEEGSPRREKNLNEPRTPGRSKTRERERRMSRNGDQDVEGEDPGEDSEPEDSETPWVCTLKIRKSGSGTTPGMSLRSRAQQGFYLQANSGAPHTIDGQEESGLLHPSAQRQILRVKVGTLSPTPHHPKVVAMLRVPFPLPDVEVEQMEMKKRGVGESRSFIWRGMSVRLLLG